MAQSKRRSSDGEPERLWRLAGLGATMASEILAGALIGWVIDRLAGTKPTVLIVGTLLGVVVGLGTFIRRALIETRRAGSEGARIAATLSDEREPDPDPNDRTGDEPADHEDAP